MKLISFLSHATLITGAAFILGLAFDLQALSLFGLTTSSAILLIAARDYTSVPAGSRLSSSNQPKRSPRAKYTLPYAA